MKTNWLLYGALGYLAWRYLKKRKGSSVPTPSPLLPNKSGEAKYGSVDAPTTTYSRTSAPGGQTINVPPSQTFKPGEL